jgi:hypothetical protein
MFRLIGSLFFWFCLATAPALALSDSAIPTKIPTYWGTSTPSANITCPIPIPSQAPGNPGRASFTDGFPPPTFNQPGAGGVPPFGQDFNGIFCQLSQWTRWYNAGGPIYYDSGFSFGIGGYPKGALIQSATIFGVFWLSTVDNNSSDPDTGGANWQRINSLTRILLTTSLTINVNAGTGVNGVGCGQGSATPCQTIQYVVNTLQDDYDLGAQTVTIQAADSGTNYTSFIVQGPWVGGDNVIIQGDLTTPANTVIDGGGSGFCAEAFPQATFTIQGFTVQNCPSGEIAAIEQSLIRFAHIAFNAPCNTTACGGLNLYTSRQSYLEATCAGSPCTASNTIAALAPDGFFIESSHQGNFRAGALTTGAQVFALTGNLSGYNAFAYATSLGDLTFTDYTSSAFNLNGHTAVGDQWTADSGGMFQILNGSTGQSLTPNFFPGTADSGYCVGDCFVDQIGHGPAAGSGTTVNTCGTGSSPPAGVAGNDFYGTVTEGTGATSCIIVFASPFSQPPYCVLVFTYNGGSALPAITKIQSTVSSLAIDHGSATGATFNYQCKGF